MYSNYRCKNVNRMSNKQNMLAQTIQGKLSPHHYTLAPKKYRNKTQLKCCTAIENLWNRCAVLRMSCTSCYDHPTTKFFKESYSFGTKRT